MGDKQIGHDSAEKCLTGHAKYIDDIGLEKNACHGYIGYSKMAHGYIKDIDFSPIKALKGILDIITYNDLSNDSIILVPVLVSIPAIHEYLNP